MEFGANGTVIKDDMPQTYTQRADDQGYQDGPRSAAGLFKWLAGSLKLFIAVEILYAAICAFLAWLYLPSTEVPFTYEQLSTIDMGIGGVTLLRLALFLFCIIMVCRVTYRLMRNVHTVDANTPEVTPGWAVGWYFIPFANLVMPANAMSEIYHHTKRLVGDDSSERSPIPAWWSAWLLSLILERISLAISGGFNGENFSATTFGLDTLASLASLCAAFFLLRLMRKTVRRQELLKHGGVAEVFA